MKTPKTAFFSCFTNSEKETHELAKHFSKHLKVQDVIFLQGTLGSGKSTMARSLIRSLADDPKKTVPSPTFTIVQTYEELNPPLWHYDLYRLESPDEIYEIGIEESLATAVSLIEWPEKLGTIRMPHPLTIHIEIIDETKRQFHFSGTHYWQDRLASFCTALENSPICKNK